MGDPIINPTTIEKANKFFDEYIGKTDLLEGLKNDSKDILDVLITANENLGSIIENQNAAAKAEPMYTSGQNTILDALNKNMAATSEAFSKINASANSQIENKRFADKLNYFNKTGQSLNVNIDSMKRAVLNSMTEAFYGSNSTYEKLMEKMTKSTNSTFSKSLNAAMTGLDASLRLFGGVGSTVGPTAQEKAKKKTDESRVVGAGSAVAKSKEDKKETERLVVSALSESSVTDASVLSSLGAAVPKDVTGSELQDLLSNDIKDLTQESVKTTMRSVDASISRVANPLVKLIPGLQKLTDAIKTSTKNMEVRARRRKAAVTDLLGKEEKRDPVTGKVTREAKTGRIDKFLMAKASPDAGMSTKVLNKVLGIGSGKMTTRAKVAGVAAKGLVKGVAGVAKMANPAMLILEVVKQIPGLIISSIAEIAALPFKLGLAFAVVAPFFAGVVKGVLTEAISVLKDALNNYITNNETMLGEKLGPLYTSKKEEEEKALAKALGSSAGMQRNFDKNIAKEKERLMKSGLDAKTAEAAARVKAAEKTMLTAELLGVADRLIPKDVSRKARNQAEKRASRGRPIQEFSSLRKTQILRAATKAANESNGKTQEQTMEIFRKYLAEIVKGNDINRKILDATNTQTDTINKKENITVQPGSPGNDRNVSMDISSFSNGTRIV